MRLPDFLAGGFFFFLVFFVSFCSKSDFVGLVALLWVGAPRSDWATGIFFVVESFGSCSKFPDRLSTLPLAIGLVAAGTAGGGFFHCIGGSRFNPLR